jgi:hypothetical protein
MSVDFIQRKLVVRRESWRELSSSLVLIRIVELLGLLPDHHSAILSEGLLPLV